MPQWKKSTKYCNFYITFRADSSKRFQVRNYWRVTELAVQVCGAMGPTDLGEINAKDGRRVGRITKYASQHELNSQICVIFKSMISRADWHQEFAFFCQQNDVEICKFRNGIQGATLRHTKANICHRRPYSERSRKRTIEILLVGLT